MFADASILLRSVFVREGARVRLRRYSRASLKYPEHGPWAMLIFSVSFQFYQSGSEYDCVNLGYKGAESQSVRFKKSEAPRTGVSFLGLMEEVVKVGQTMGYNMKGCVNNLSEIIASHGVSMETKMEKMEVFCVRNCWGNYEFDFIHSNSVGNSGGILCVWDPNSFRKSSSTISDYFVIVRGVRRKSGTDLIIIAVYAPHDPRDKRMLWDYLMHVINQWNGEVIIMGDFN
ncbi:RNA-directed DNA polymerase, eukaryota [Tanacetum coccineum]